MKIITAMTVGALPLVLSTVSYGQFVIDGTLDTAYGSANAVQSTQTGFGDSSLGLPDFADGSEIDSGYAVVSGGFLYIMLPGNLESNFNKIDIFIDARAGGQNILRGDNPDVDFNGINRMGDDGTGNGLTFDAGFEADMWVSMTCGGAVFETFANYAELHTLGAGFGQFIGSGSSGAAGTIVGKTGMMLALDNSNISGVTGGIGNGCGEGVTTGIEIAIPLFLFDWDGGAGTITSVKVCAFINGGGHDFLSNQVIGGLGASDNLGEPRSVNFDSIPGNQFFTSGDVAAPCPAPSGECCLAANSCSDLTSVDCLALGGTYGGDGTACNVNSCVPVPCEGDVNGDGIVNVSDVLLVIGNWGCVQ